MYEYSARVIRVVDGDTIDLDIDLGFSIHMKQRVRVLGVNCPEMHGATKEAGIAATKFTQNWLDELTDGEVRIKTIIDKKDSFGRVLAEIRRAPENSLSDALLASGHAVEMRK